MELLLDAKAHVNAQAAAAHHPPHQYLHSQFLSCTCSPCMGELGAQEDASGLTALHYACRKGDTMSLAVLSLIDAGADAGAVRPSRVPLSRPAGMRPHGAAELLSVSLHLDLSLPPPPLSLSISISFSRSLSLSLSRWLCKKWLCNAYMCCTGRLVGEGRSRGRERRGATKRRPRRLCPLSLLPPLSVSPVPPRPFHA